MTRATAKRDWLRYESDSEANATPDQSGVAFFRFSAIIENMKKVNLAKKIFGFFLVAVFLTVDFAFHATSLWAADEPEDIRKDMDKIEEKIEKEEAGLQQNQTELNITQRQISGTAYELKKTTQEISEKEKELERIQKRIELNKKIMAAYAQEMYINDSESSWALGLSDVKFSQYFENFDQMLSIKEKLLTVAEEVRKDKDETETVKKELAEKKEDHEVLLVAKQAEKNEIVGEINEAKLTIAQLQSKLNKLRSTLSKFLGSSYTMDDVIEAVKFAEKKTNVRKEFLFAVLDKETDLGRFTGGCTYKNSKMGDKNAEIFKNICDDLGYDYKKMKVSCPLSYGIGGAMGVAQFMPTTWAGQDGKSGYAPKISSLTNSDPADPWNLKDGIMGMALYLKNRGGDKKSGEKTAAAAYYCGSRLERTVCQNYANTVISWSKGYDDYF